MALASEAAKLQGKIDALTKDINVKQQFAATSARRLEIKAMESELRKFKSQMSESAIVPDPQFAAEFAGSAQAFAIQTIPTLLP